MTNPQFSRKTDDWATPQPLFDVLDNEFGFICDVAASMQNSKCAVFIDSATDALEVAEWGQVNWCNPPYSKTKEFILKAREQQKLGKLTVMLIPARTDTRLFHEHIYEKEGVEIRFIKGRVKFVHPDGGLLRGTSMNGSNNAAPFPSMLVVLRPKLEESK